MYCLDTNLVIDVFRGKNPSLKSKIEYIKSLGAGFAITTITLCELYKGAFLSSNKEQSIAQVNEFLESVSLYTQDKLSCSLFGQDFALLKDKGVQTEEADLMIASICKANNCILVTRNVKDFRNVPNLVVNSW
ncbi:type II toxin-antitoxin system VapC family toxin [Candidatus Woesearchaeota archaeon]|nr:type II toxin-antitoxin system VapC family toxin [Candidatus Woesearchaeota archaeon]